VSSCLPELFPELNACVGSKSSSSPDLDLDLDLLLLLLLDLGELLRLLEPLRGDDEFISSSDILLY